MSFQVLFIHGPAAAGKHTIGTLVAQHTGWPLFHNHLTVDLVKTLFEFGSAGFRQLRADIWRASFRAAAASGQSFIFTFNPEATVDPDLMVELDNIVQQAGGQVVYVELRCNMDELAARMDNASRAAFGKLTDPVLFKQLLTDGSFDFPALPQPALVLDTDELSADDAARQIYQCISGR